MDRQPAPDPHRLWLHNGLDGAVVLDPVTGRILTANDAAARMFGFESRQIMAGVDPLDHVAQEHRAFVARMARRSLTEDRPIPAEIRMITRDGRTISVSVTTALVDFEGSQAALAVVRDVTERRHAEDALKASEERFRGLVETTSDWVWETDRTGRFTYVSPRVLDILGYQPQQLLGHTPYEFIDPGEVPQVRRTVRGIVSSRQPFSLLENTWMHRDGHTVVLEASAVPILQGDGGFLGYRGINRDITERKRVELELQRSLSRLEKTMQSTIEAFTSTIETRDPYTAGHQMRVADLACTIARAMGLPPARVQGVQVAGLLHDIGKIAIPTEILSKPGRLNRLEYVMIRTHAQVGHDILQKIEFHWPVATAVLQHHERWNGSGYPAGICGEGIIPEARILAVADVVEAMSSHRPYRPSMGPERALQEITGNSGTLYDPDVSAACISAFTRNSFRFAHSAADGRF